VVLQLWDWARGNNSP